MGGEPSRPILVAATAANNIEGLTCRNRWRQDHTRVTMEQRLLLRRDLTYAMKMVRAAMDDLIKIGGASEIALPRRKHEFDSPTERPLENTLSPPVAADSAIESSGERPALRRQPAVPRQSFPDLSRFLILRPLP
jgi:hypothetical protein